MDAESFEKLIGSHISPLPHRLSVLGLVGTPLPHPLVEVQVAPSQAGQQGSHGRRVPRYYLHQGSGGDM